MSEQDLSGPPSELGTVRPRLADSTLPDCALHLVPDFLTPLKTHSNIREGSAFSSSPTSPSEQLGPSTQRGILELFVGRRLSGCKEARVTDSGCAQQTVLLPSEPAAPADSRGWQ